MPVSVAPTPSTLCFCGPQGLRLRVIESANLQPASRSRFGVVSLQLWIGSGSTAETDSQWGLAHFLEHLLFKPWAEPLTLKAPVGPRVQCRDLAGAIEALGGDSNAYTSHEETVYFAHVPVQSVDAALQVFAQSVFFPSLSPPDIDTERGVIIEEIHQYADDAPSCAQDALMENLYSGKPLGRTILGSEDSLRQQDAASIRAFHRRHYVAQNALLVVAGPVDAAKIASRFDEIFAEVPSGRRRPSGKALVEPPAMISKPAQGAKRGSPLWFQRRDVHESTIRIAWAGPGLATDAAVALDAAMVILGQGESSRLHRRLVREHKVALDVQAHCELHPVSSTLFVSLQCEAESTLSATTLAWAEIRALAAAGCEDRELQRAKAMLRSSLVYRRETVQGMAHATGWSVMLGGDDAAEDRYFAQLEALTSQALQIHVQAWLKGPSAAMAVVVPETKVSAAAATKLKPKLKALAKDDKAQKGGKRGRKRRAKTWGKGTHYLELGEDLTLILRNDPRVPMFSAQWLMAGGPYDVPLAKRGRHALLARLLMRGTQAQSGVQLAEDIEGVAAMMDGLCGWERQGVTFEGLRENAGMLLDRAAACLWTPALREEDFEHERKRLLEELAADQDELAHVAIIAARKKLYRSHPYAADRRGSPESVAKTTYKDVRRAHAQMVSRPSVLVVVGDLELDAVAEAAQRSHDRYREGAKAEGKAKENAKENGEFGLWPRTPAVAAQWPKRDQRVKIQRDRDQVHIAYAYPGLDIFDPRVPALEVALQILGASAGRLFERMREREALVYAVSSFAHCGLGAGHVTVYAASARDKLEKSCAAIEEVVHELARKGPSREELARAKHSLMGQSFSAMQRRGRQVSQLASLFIQDLPPEHPQRMLAAIKKSTAGQVAELVTELMADGTCVRALVGPDL